MRFSVPLRGVDVDAQTRCAHYSGPTDIVALRCACCDVFYPCHACHEAATGRSFAPWPLARADEPAVLCGACRTAMTPEAYRASGDACPACNTRFNPGCRAHHALYFEAAPEP